MNSLPKNINVKGLVYKEHGKPEYMENIQKILPFHLENDDFLLEVIS